MIGSRQAVETNVWYLKLCYAVAASFSMELRGRRRNTDFTLSNGYRLRTPSNTSLCPTLAILGKDWCVVAWMLIISFRWAMSHCLTKTDNQHSSNDVTICPIIWQICLVKFNSITWWQYRSSFRALIRAFITGAIRVKEKVIHFALPYHHNQVYCITWRHSVEFNTCPLARNALIQLKVCIICTALYLTLALY